MASVAINVLDPAFYVDPWQAYRWLRDEAPVYWDPVQKLWAVSRYRDVCDIENDAERYCSSDGSRPLTDQRDDMSMINLDDPQHRDVGIDLAVLPALRQRRGMSACQLAIRS